MCPPTSMAVTARRTKPGQLARMSFRVRLQVSKLKDRNFRPAVEPDRDREPADARIYIERTVSCMEQTKIKLIHTPRQMNCAKERESYLAAVRMPRQHQIILGVAELLDPGGIMHEENVSSQGNRIQRRAPGTETGVADN